MPRRFFTRISKRFDRNKEHPWYLKPFNFLLSHPVYFAATRRGVSGGIALGLFIGLFPLPGQTALAIIGALLLRVNLPLAAVAVWITNPITFLPVFFLEYRIGAALLNIPVEVMPPQASIEWLTSELASRFRPLMYGAFLMATSLASVAYLGVSTLWHVLTINRYRRRHKKGVSA